MILLWIYRLITPVVFIWGGIVFCSGEYVENDIRLGIILAIIGFIWGLLTWSFDLAPRVFWVKSPFFLFQTRIFTAIESALVFFLTPSFITGLKVLIEACQDKF